MGWNNLTVNDYGYTCRLVLVQATVPQDISTYETLEFIFTKPGGDEIIRSVQFGSDGTDGALVYVVAQGDIALVGEWDVRARISKTGVRLTSEKLQFLVTE